jgi:hypothetical protein
LLGLCQSSFLLNESGYHSDLMLLH